MPEKFYWDSCCFLGLIKQESGRYEALRSLYKRAESGNLVIITSTLTLSEVCKVRCEEGSGSPRQQMGEEGDHFLERFFDNDFFWFVDVTPKIGHTARALYRAHPEIKITNDAIHLATALQECVDEMHTYDNNDLISLSDRITDEAGSWFTICVPQAIEPDLLSRL